MKARIALLGLALGMLAGCSSNPLSLTLPVEGRLQADLLSLSPVAAGALASVTWVGSVSPSLSETEQ